VSKAGLTELPPKPGGMVVRSLVAVLCFLIYAAAILALPQDRSAAYTEQDGPIPLVVSHWFYGTKLGLADPGLTRFFRRHEPIEAAIETAIHHSDQVPLTGRLALMDDGIGVGGMIATNLGFALFGTRARALPLLFVSLLGLSVLCFVARYRDRRLLAVPLVLAGLTLLLMTPIAQDSFSAGAIPWGGVRSYAVMGILPALHWVFAVGERAPQSRPMRLADLALSAIQAAILAFSILVRGAPMYLLFPVAGAAAWTWHCRAVPRSDIARRLLVPGLVLTIGLFVLPRLAFPEYKAAGRLYETAWARVTVGVARRSPHWPFPGLQQTYICPDIVGGMAPQNLDQIADCIWQDYEARHGKTLQEANAKELDGDYQAVQRDAAIAWLFAYPRQMLELYLWDKPIDIFWETVAALRPVWGAAIAPFVALQLCLFIAFSAIRPPANPSAEAGRMLRLIGGFFAAALLVQLATYTNLWTGVDLFLYVLCGALLVLWLAVTLLCQRLERSSEPLQNEA
jgi:hypothetical protein